MFIGIIPFTLLKQQMTKIKTKQQLKFRKQSFRNSADFFGRT